MQSDSRSLEIDVHRFRAAITHLVVNDGYALGVRMGWLDSLNQSCRLSRADTAPRPCPRAYIAHPTSDPTTVPRDYSLETIMRSILPLFHSKEKLACVRI